MIFRDPRRERTIFDAHAERCIYALSPHESARRRPPEKKRKPGPLASDGTSLRSGAKQRTDLKGEIADVIPVTPFQATMAEGCYRTFIKSAQ